MKSSKLEMETLSSKFEHYDKIGQVRNQPVRL